MRADRTRRAPKRSCVDRDGLLSLLAGAEYEVRFLGESDGLYGYLALGFGYGKL